MKTIWNKIKRPVEWWRWGIVVLGAGVIGAALDDYFGIRFVLAITFAGLASVFLGKQDE